MYQTLRYEKQENIGILTINRPEALNALNTTVISELEQAVTEIENDAELRALILTGEGRSFVAGADIGQMSTLTAAEGKAFGVLGNRVFLKLENLTKPPNAEGKGGAKFGQPEVGLGITPGFSGTQRLPRRVGIAKAKELIFSGKVIGAAEAEKIGLVNAVYAPEELIPGAIAMAKSFTANAPIAVKYSKACIDRGMQMDIDDGIALENELFAMCYATADQKEGMGAFLEKRKEKHFQNK